ncbi:thioredoxin family protein [Halpernia frigidisoli]|uniref:Thioredoxin-like n=1 Tax=Halpernia frigidisoli TaxID=1125876 RepID=A0A1I3FHZ0_9FLAO|nr:thioredoxin fold domain-containing protein [Halpernia frigidisoli]SFI10833.1 Thioredoxin-like [Halpernia frigidisoli]
MNKIKYILFLLISLQVFSQESINFSQKPFAELMAQAKAEKKLIFLDAYASWCGPCKLLEKNVFPKPAVRDFFNKTFINTHIDMEKGEGPGIAQKYMIRSYPSLLFINGDGEIIQKALGYMGEEDFLALGKEAGNPLNAKESPKALFAKGEKNPQFLETIIKNNANSDYNFAKSAAERYFEVKNTKELSKEEISYILYFVKSTKDPLYKEFVKNKEEITKSVPLETYNQFDQQIKLSEVLEASVNESDGGINDEYFFKNAVPIVGRADAEKALNRTKVALYPQTGNFEGYEKAALEYYKDADSFDAKELDKAAWIFSQNITNVNSLNEAKMWSEKSVMKGENPENTYILAKLYQKTGDTEKARSFAKMSADISAQSGKDASLATALLTELNK